MVVTPVLSGNATATDIPTDIPTVLNLQDPDSMILNVFGDRFWTVRRTLNCTKNGASVQIDDTVFATASHGVILVSDRDGETVYAISRNILSPGAAYSATPNSVASLDQQTGVLTDVVTGMVSPHGTAFTNEP